MHVTNEQAGGAALGGILGFFKSLTLITMISWDTVLDTALLSAVGTLVGLVITTTWKIIRTKIKKS